MENKQQTEIKQGTRLKEIIAVMRKYHFISNFYHQRLALILATRCKN